MYNLVTLSRSFKEVLAVFVVGCGTDNRAL